MTLGVSQKDTPSFPGFSDSLRTTEGPHATTTPWGQEEALGGDSGGGRGESGGDGRKSQLLHPVRLAGLAHAPSLEAPGPTGLSAELTQGGIVALRFALLA